MSISTNQSNCQRVLNIKNNEITTRKVKVRKLSRKGCLNCKRRKIKCDEIKPCCLKCQKKYYVCSWPEPPKQTKRKIENIEVEESSVEIFSPSTVDSPDSISSFNSFDRGNENLQIMYNSPIEFVQNESDTDSTFDTNYLKYNIFSKSALSQHDMFCYYAFANGFLRNIGQSYFREKFSIVKALPRLWKDNNIIREIHFACGSSFLLFDGQFSELGHKRYLKALKTLLNEIKKRSADSIEDWIIEAAQTLQFLCLKDFFTGDQQIHALNHLNFTYHLLKSRIQNMAYQLTSGKEDDKLELVCTSILKKSPFIRPMIENFLINYVFFLVFCESKYLGSLVPNPYNAQSFFNISLTVVENLEDDWFNRETFTITNHAFKIAAQCTWSLRKESPLSEERIDSLRIMLEVSLKFLTYLESQKTHTILDENLKNIYKGSMVLRGCIIVTSKLINPEIRVSDVQEELDKMIEDIEKPVNDDIILPIWCLYLGAVCSTSVGQRMFFRSKFTNLVNRMNSYTILSILNYLDNLWNQYTYEELFEKFFDGSLLKEQSI